MHGLDLYFSVYVFFVIAKRGESSSPFSLLNLSRCSDPVASELRLQDDVLTAFARYWPFAALRQPAHC